MQWQLQTHRPSPLSATRCTQQNVREVQNEPTPHQVCDDGKRDPGNERDWSQSLLGLWAQPELGSPISSFRALPLTYNRVEPGVGSLPNPICSSLAFEGKNRFLGCSFSGGISPWVMVSQELGARSQPFPPCFHLPAGLAP